MGAILIEYPPALGSDQERLEIDIDHLHIAATSLLLPGVSYIMVSGMWWMTGMRIRTR